MYVCMIVITATEHHDSVMGDSFIADNIGELLRTVRSQVLLQLIPPYQCIHLPYVSRVCALC